MKQIPRRGYVAALASVASAGCTNIVQKPRENSPSDISDGTPSEVPDTTPSEPPHESPTETDRPPSAPDQLDSGWVMPANDIGLSNSSTGASGASSPVQQIWTFETDTRLSSPIISSETLYSCGSNGSIYAIDALSGEADWVQRVSNGAFTPSVIAEILYVPTTHGVLALEADSGKSVWSRETPNRPEFNGSAEFIAHRPVLVAPHGVYYVSEGDTEQLFRLDLRTGEIKWKGEFSDPWTGHIFANNDSIFVSTDHNGQVPWTFDVKTGDITQKPSGNGADFEDERFYRNGSVYSVNQMFKQVESTAVTPSGNDWNTGLPSGGQIGAAADSKRLYLHVNSNESVSLYALSTKDGSTEWKTNLNAASETYISRPVVTDDTVYVSTEHEFWCFEVETGEKRWSSSKTSLGYKTIAIDDLLYSTTDGNIHALR